MIIVPTSSPGFKTTPIVTVGSVVTQATYYDDVRVPVGNVVGDVNAGWRLITNQLNHERVGLAALAGLTFRLYDDAEAWCRETDAGGAHTGQKMIDVPWVQTQLADAHAQLEAMSLLNWRMASAVADGTLTPTDASSVKVFGVETQIRVYRILLEILGAGGYVRANEPGALLKGEVERAVRAAQINTFGGGVVEVLREIVATVGLGMTRQLTVSRAAEMQGGGTLTDEANEADDAEKAAFYEKLLAFEGVSTGEQVGHDEVNQPMIRHWVDAMGDKNPIYTDADAAEKSVHGEIIAPPVMLQAWVMRGLSPRPTTGGSKQDELMNLLDGAGFSSVVATNCEQEYDRMLHLGDHLRRATLIDSVSEEKHDRARRRPLRDDARRVRDARRRARRPPAVPHPQVQARDGQGPRRGTPPDGRGSKPTRRSARGPRSRSTTSAGSTRRSEHRLLIQRCSQCQTLRHPPRPRCDKCGSYEWNALEASGRGTVYSFVVEPLPAGAGVRLPAADRADRARGGHAPRRRPRRRRARRRQGRHGGRGRLAGPRRRAHAARLQAGRRLSAGAAVDFSLTEEQDAVRGLAEQIFAGLGHASSGSRRSRPSDEPHRPRPVARARRRRPARHLAARVEHGGRASGSIAMCLVLEQQGRVVAPVPYWASLVLRRAADRRVRHRRAAGQAGCPASCAASSLLTAALAEPGVNDPLHPR